MAKRTCSIDGCEKDHVARGWCAMHYVRWKTHGTPGPAEPHRQYGRTGCDVAGCNRPHSSLGFCERHKHQAMRFGLTATQLSAMNDACPI